MPVIFSNPRRRWRWQRGVVLVLAFAVAVSVPARDVFVLLSGGGTPLTNNYSQYLQARALAADLQRTRAADSVWIFFGIGNREGEPARLADVHRQVKEGGLLRDTWLPGVIPHNRPASKEEFLQALREEILPAVRDGGTLFLYIGDHGSLARKEPKESVVTMWQMKNPDGRDRGWNTDPEEELSVTELRAALAAGLGKGRVVFCMTQCHSGGFHFLGVPRAVQPDPVWFTAVPDWAAPREGKPLPFAAGFTSADEESPAAGCDPDPDPDKWAGYERFAPEALLGIGLFDGRKTGPVLPSYAAAHEAAVLVDQTIDKPRSSSEQFLERWARLIDRLAQESRLTPEAKRQVAAYQRAVDTGLAEATDEAFATKRAQFTRFLAQLCAQNQPAADLLRTGTAAGLEQAIGVKKDVPGGHGDTTGGPDERRKLWQGTIRPAWKAAVEAGQVKDLTGAALGFEKYLLAQEEKGRELMFSPGWQNPLLNDMYWRSGYAFPAQLDAKRAKAVTRWGALRRQKIAEWAKVAPDAKVAAAAVRLWPADQRAGANPGAPPRTLSRKIAAERTLFYRRVLAAWAF
ncbi:MAG: hypothetical protein ACHQ5A_14080, partial [Opitutales bacterium]